MHRAPLLAIRGNQKVRTKRVGDEASTNGEPQFDETNGPYLENYWRCRSMSWTTVKIVVRVKYNPSL